MIRSPPCESVTARVASYAPAGYWWVTTGPLAVEPSPNTQAKLKVSSSGSNDPDASNVTVSGDSPLSGVTVALATGWRFDPSTNEILRSRPDPKLR